MKKNIILLIKYLDGFLSAASCRIVVLTGKSKYPIHPKHLVKQQIWFYKFLHKNDAVLDLGCGLGQLTIQTAKVVQHVTGVEVDEKLLSIATKRAESQKVKNIKFIQADLNKKFPFSDNSFNQVICNDVLEHLYKRDFALKEIKRVLKKNGLLFLVTDNPNNSWKRLQKSVRIFYYADSDHKYEYPKDEIINKLQKTGFNIVKVSTVTYETPLKGLIDLTGGFSLTLYLSLRNWRQNMNNKYPEETVGYRIIAKLQI